MWKILDIVQGKQGHGKNHRENVQIEAYHLVHPVEFSCAKSFLIHYLHFYVIILTLPTSCIKICLTGT